MTEPVSLKIAVASSGEAMSIGTFVFVDKPILSTQMLLLYVWSLATDRPGLSVGHPVGAQFYFVSGFYYMVGARLCETLSVKMKMTSHLGSKMLYPYQLFLVPTHVVLFQSPYCGI